MSIQTGGNVSKGTTYTVLAPPKGTSAAKAVAYAVLSADSCVDLSKSVGYAVIVPVAETVPPVTVAGGSNVIPRMTDWLVKRLTPVKRGTQRWVDLARAIQNFWEDNFDPELDKCSRLSSIYTADLDGKRRIVAELGDYFDASEAEIAIPLMVAVRKLELAMKDTDYLIRAVIQRKQSDLTLTDRVKWLPLWALESDGPYGTQFYHEEAGIPDGAYLTSRGVLWTSRAQMLQSDLDIDMLVRTLKPLHITYDGLQSSSPGYWQSGNLITQAGEHVLTGDGDNIVTGTGA